MTIIGKLHSLDTGITIIVCPNGQACTLAFAAEQLEEDANSRIGETVVVTGKMVTPVKGGLPMFQVAALGEQLAT